MFEKRLDGHPKSKLSSTPSSFNKLCEFLDTNESYDEGCIYFHVPYCDNICSFCAMNRTKLDGKLDDYLEFLLKEIEFYSSKKYFKNKPISSIYFGGGTPTIFKTHHLKALLSAINKSFKISQDVEYSSESTLHNLSLDKLLTMQELGINRYSFGIQSFNSDARKFFNRVGDKNYAVKRINEIRKDFRGTLCCDIIYNYPNQSIDEVLEDARLVDELGIDSVSFYTLRYFEKSKMASVIDKNYYDINIDRKLHDSFLKYSLDHGFKIMEHTKVVKNDEYRYIRMRHNAKDTLPIGVGAGGSIGDFSIHNMNKDMKMVALKSPVIKHATKLYNLFEYEYVDLDLAYSYIKEPYISRVQEFLKSCENFGYVSMSGNKMKFNFDGIFFGNNIGSGVANICEDYFKENL